MIVTLTMLGSVKMTDTLDEFKRQHVENYRKAVIELIKNNTNVLFDEDIKALIAKPPLDSMDTIKVKFLEIAKKNHIILNTVNLTKLIDDYRFNLLKWISDFKDSRIQFLVNIVSNYQLINDNDLIKLNKKDFTDINRKLKKQTKEKIIYGIDKKIVNNVNSIFTKEISEDVKNKMILEIKKFLTGKYQKQLLENIDFKVLVKDTTLINLIREQGERYIFTKKNSYIFKQN